MGDRVIYIPEEDAVRAERVCDMLGIPFEMAVRILVKQIVYQRGIPCRLIVQEYTEDRAFIPHPFSGGTVQARGNDAAGDGREPGFADNVGRGHYAQAYEEEEIDGDLYEEEIDGDAYEEGQGVDSDTGPRHGPGGMSDGMPDDRGGAADDASQAPAAKADDDDEDIDADLLLEGLDISFEPEEGEIVIGKNQMPEDLLYEGNRANEDSIPELNIPDDFDKDEDYDVPEDTENAAEAEEAADADDGPSGYENHTYKKPDFDNMPGITRSSRYTAEKERREADTDTDTDVDADTDADFDVSADTDDDTYTEIVSDTKNVPDTGNDSDTENTSAGMDDGVTGDTDETEMREEPSDEEPYEESADAYDGGSYEEEPDFDGSFEPEYDEPEGGIPEADISDMDISEPDVPEPDEPDVDAQEDMPSGRDTDKDTDAAGKADGSASGEKETERALPPHKKPVDVDVSALDDGTDQTVAMQVPGLTQKEAEKLAADYRVVSDPECIKLRKQDFTFAYTKLRIKNKRTGEDEKIALISMPLSIIDKNPDILACMIFPDEHTEVRTSMGDGKKNIRFKIGGTVVMLKAVTRGGKYEPEIYMPKSYQEEGFDMDVDTRLFGDGGHIIIRDTNAEVHLLPAAFQNNENGRSEFIYCVHTPEGVTCGDTSIRDEVTITSGGERFKLVGRWREEGGNQVLYAMVRPDERRSRK